LNREEVRQHALAYSWDAATDQFLQNLAPAVESKTESFLHMVLSGREMVRPWPQSAGSR
jgi:hypothetical protein